MILLPAILATGVALAPPPAPAQSDISPARSADAPASPLLPVASWSVVNHVRIAPLGELLSCAMEEHGPVPPSLGANCASVAQFPRESLLIYRGGPGPGAMAVDIAASMSVDGDASRPPVPVLPRGRRVIAGVAAAISIGPDGAVESCRIVERRGVPALAENFCANMFGPFEPTRGASGAPQRRSATVRYSVVTERAPHLRPATR